MPKPIEPPALTGALQTFELLCHINLQEDWWAKLPTELAEGRDFLVRWVLPHKAGVCDLHAFEVVKGHVVLSVTIFRTPSHVKAQPDPRFGQAIEAVASATTRSTRWRVSAGLEYRGDRPSLVKLPVPVDLGGVADQVAGFRFEKSAAGTLEYSIVVDRVGDDLEHSVSYFTKAKLTDQMIRKSIARCVEISGQFLAPES